MNRMKLESVVHSLGMWFAERDIPTDHLTLILNVAERHAAARLDAYVSAELNDPLVLASTQVIDTARFTMRGINIKIESPLHRRHRYAVRE